MTSDRLVQEGGGGGQKEGQPHCPLEGLDSSSSKILSLLSSGYLTYFTLAMRTVNWYIFSREQFGNVYPNV